MLKPSADSLSRRERQIMDILHRVRRGTVVDARAQLATGGAGGESVRPMNVPCRHVIGFR